jgi:hypothetical protein
MMTILKLRQHSFAIVAILLVAIATGWISSVDVAATVTPPSVSVTLDPGDSTSLTKTVTTPTIPPNPDIAFLADTTGSMGGALANVQTNASTVLSTILIAQPTAQFSVSEYRDIGDAFGRFRVNQALTANQTDVQNAISGWSAGGGGDTPEAQLSALNDVATGAAGWRSGSTRIAVWFGDQPGHDPSDGVTEASATAALISAGVQVVAVDVSNLDSTGQATGITSATGGSLETSGDEVSAAILAGLSNLPITVTPSVSCGAGVSVSLSPASVTTTSGDPVIFTETITASGTVAEGSEIHCTVTFETDGGPIGTQEVWVTIPDKTAPIASCDPTVNPHGETVPRAGEKSPGQNEDGFYELLANDNLDGLGDLSVFVTDTGSGTVFGPFAVGDAIKYTEDSDTAPASKSIGSGSGQADAIAAHIIGNGDAAVFAVDQAGNVSDSALCLVPKPPK